MNKQSKGNSSDTVTIFDWDDTLLPSNWLVRNGNYPFEGVLKTETQMQTRQSLESIGCAVYDCLAKALFRGPVFIITNSMEGWVQRSAIFYMPILTNLLKYVRIISARSMFPKEPPSHWKLLAFRQCLHDLYSSPYRTIYTRVVSIGDSNYERNALFSLSHSLASPSLISVKFKEEPTIQDLKNQLFCLQKLLADIFQCSHHSDIFMDSFC
mmetsp:Transcript_16835/g.22265  ORF Transcript_16835/g.22265 Transcript_16835/m.22265 type:complete len:211 (-) Transcript_16835:120-752(-)